MIEEKHEGKKKRHKSKEQRGVTEARKEEEAKRSGTYPKSNVHS